MIYMLLSTIIAVVVSVSAQSSENSDVSSPAYNDFIFDLPDLVTTYNSPWGELHLEAFGARGNAAILQSGEIATKDNQAQLYWVSIGAPAFIALPTHSEIPDNSTEEEEIFHFLPDSVFSYLETLSPSHRDMLAATANYKYNITIRPSQIAHLILEKFDCILGLYLNGQKFIMKGEVTDFRTFPLRIDFSAPEGSVERLLFEKRLRARSPSRKGRSGGQNFRFSCEIASAGRKARTNSFSLSTNQIQEMRITERLLGPATSAFVTRSQLTELSDQLYSSLNIVEEYEIPQHQFAETFVDELIRQAVGSQFTHVPILDALKELSTFGTSFTRDLAPDEVVKELGSILKVDKFGNKSHIIVNEEKMQDLKEMGQSESGGGGSFSFFGIKLGGSAKKVRDSSKNWSKSSKSLNDQLAELNTESENDIRWSIDGTKIIPRSINVAKVSAATFSRSLNFQRIRRTYIDAPFKRTTALYTQRATRPKDIFVEMQSSLLQMKEKLTSNEKEIQRLVSLATNLTTEIRNLRSIMDTQVSDLGRLKGNGKQCRVCVMGSAAGSSSYNKCVDQSEDPKTSPPSTGLRLKVECV